MRRVLGSPIALRSIRHLHARDHVYRKKDFFGRLKDMLLQMHGIKTFSWHSRSPLPAELLDAVQGASPEVHIYIHLQSLSSKSLEILQEPRYASYPLSVKYVACREERGTGLLFRLLAEVPMLQRLEVCHTGGGGCLPHIVRRGTPAYSLEFGVSRATPQIQQLSLTGMMVFSIDDIKRWGEAGGLGRLRTLSLNSLASLVPFAEHVASCLESLRLHHTSKLELRNEAAVLESLGSLKSLSLAGYDLDIPLTFLGSIKSSLISLKIHACETYSHNRVERRRRVVTSIKDDEALDQLLPKLQTLSIDVDLTDGWPSKLCHAISEMEELHDLTFWAGGESGSSSEALDNGTCMQLFHFFREFKRGCKLSRLTIKCKLISLKGELELGPTFVCRQRPDDTIWVEECGRLTRYPEPTQPRLPVPIPFETVRSQWVDCSHQELRAVVALIDSEIRKEGYRPPPLDGYRSESLSDQCQTRIVERFLEDVMVDPEFMLKDETFEPLDAATHLLDYRAKLVELLLEEALVPKMRLPQDDHLLLDEWAATF